MDGKPAGMTANVPHGTIKFSRKEELCVAKIVAIANQKGGVGKTTTAVNLSSCVAALGKRVLIVDLDPQGNTTTGYGIPKRSVEKGTYEILIGEARASEAIRKTEYRTDVIGPEYAYPVPTVQSPPERPLTPHEWKYQDYHTRHRQPAYNPHQKRNNHIPPYRSVC